MIDAILLEAEIQKDYLSSATIKTIYFGGGTPSLLESEQIVRIVEKLRQLHVIATDAEITLEANPDDLNQLTLRRFAAAGVNRLSIGIQSFNDEVLKFLNRAHNAQSAAASVRMAREEGFDNISIDLIYAIPGQNESQWRQEISTALSLHPEHLSSYALTIEPRTAFGNWYGKGLLVPADEHLAATQFEILLDEVEQAGYLHYEVSNFALPGRISKHNSSYWRQAAYLGLGPSAHSYNGDVRQHNISNNARYTKEIFAGRLPAELEILSIPEKVNDRILTGLRTMWGLDVAALRDQFGYDIAAQREGYLNMLLKENLAALSNNILVLTRKGKLVADQIASDLFMH